MYHESQIHPRWMTLAAFQLKRKAHQMMQSPTTECLGHTQQSRHYITHSILEWTRFMFQSFLPNQMVCLISQLNSWVVYWNDEGYNFENSCIKTMRINSFCSLSHPIRGWNKRTRVGRLNHAQNTIQYPSKMDYIYSSWLFYQVASLGSLAIADIECTTYQWTQMNYQPYKIEKLYCISSTCPLNLYCIHLLYFESMKTI